LACLPLKAKKCSPCPIDRDRKIFCVTGFMITAIGDRNEVSENEVRANDALWCGGAIGSM
jgi:hypothetical protein